MEETTVLFQIVEKYGLFVALVVYVLWDQRRRESVWIEREEKYIGVIDKLSDSFDAIKKDVDSIKTKLWG